MKIQFYKYQGTGNDFVMIDNRTAKFDTSNTALINTLCDRRFGIGADGLILLENHPTHDFKMVYFNADGNESTMCGNGGRCLVAFAKDLGVISGSCVFEAIDGLHHANITNDNVELKMLDVDAVEDHDTHMFLDTGSPHHVQFVKKDLKTFNVKDVGRSIRYGAPYFDEGTNVNFVEHVNDNTFNVRTYERGVEDETLSCGTGVTAVALAMHYKGYTNNFAVNLNVMGGQLQVSFAKSDNIYTDIWLIGPAKQVFKGEILC